MLIGTWVTFLYSCPCKKFDRKMGDRPKRNRKLNSFYFGDDMISAHTEKRHKSNESKANSGDNDTEVCLTYFLK